MSRGEYLRTENLEHKGSMVPTLTPKQEECVVGLHTHTHTHTHTHLLRTCTHFGLPLTHPS